MNPPLRHTLWFNGAATVAGLGALLVGLLLYRDWRRLPSIAPPDSYGPGAAPVAYPPAEGPDWSVLRPSSRAHAAAPPLAQRFRLAGTLFGFGVGSAEPPQAILDDTLRVEQRLVRRGAEVAPGIRLLEVRRDSVVLEGPAGVEELWIERVGRPAPDGAQPAGPSARPDAAGRDEGDATSRFGGREVFPGRWEFDRSALLSYYAQLRAEPERLLAVFDSMQPLYRDGDPATREITGYRLDVRGEAPFFEAMGVRPGDIVRSVNSVAMTNRRRAESFIRAFVEEQEDTFVIEVERDGDVAKQVYLIR